MGFWDKVKSVALSAKCMTGWHSGEYERVPGTPDCYFKKKCSDCGKEMEINRHKYGDLKYKYPAKCDAIRICIYCEHELDEIAHKYEDLGFDRNCQEKKQCARCGDLKVSKPHHDYQIVGKDSDCKEILKCVRCGNIKTGLSQHNYRTTGKDSNCREIQECDRCHHVHIGRAQHNWVSLLGHDVKISGKRKCRDCGVLE